MAKAAHKRAPREKKPDRETCHHPTVILERVQHEDMRLEYLTGKHVCLVCGVRLVVKR